ncbi:hypothetical protein NKR17_09925 [Priestia flexa]|uniref:Uncharacterized protein n=1 Tax=Priestia flexa TaxID=86664 RepID=A0ABU4JC08_9BACI|nr:hypothetical protein [Priestia flexa]MBY6088671.1 hypothetical protein [Priestia flexa]MCP1189387.1 hypothetical protein [Priestia flexa]MDW8518536.1 hypothetical protein [Priestia flexa]QCS53890.1 hypothetical protein FED53_15475 [Priestia flexa]SIR55420.1 hypothetical protein SAMN05880580_1366 [Priestia flexa]
MSRVLNNIDNFKYNSLESNLLDYFSYDLTFNDTIISILNACIDKVYIDNSSMNSLCKDVQELYKVSDRLIVQLCQHNHLAQLKESRIQSLILKNSTEEINLLRRCSLIEKIIELWNYIIELEKKIFECENCKWDDLSSIPIPFDKSIHEGNLKRNINRFILTYISKVNFITTLFYEAYDSKYDFTYTQINKILTYNLKRHVESYGKCINSQRTLKLFF